MADNSEETKGTEATENAESAANEAASSEGAGMNDEQSFAYWIVLLPFIAFAVVSLYEFSQAPGEYIKLINAAGLIVVGIFAATVVNVLSHGSTDPREEASSEEAAGGSSS